ncbi:Rieske 2Fe-2S domain-containing protein [Paraflavitalea sp. CAU 1676]|uniref:Rieske (2Fe-2S) protein n=1 Tax=Paraflavitalea sp. CAU 1676 TaxID=3032598 RepID=UPI0023DB3112|nr:Rieske 2Fe-2S domain-containing protein [Paraflavitalea sp. CAU 1676]MDF2186819.1 Rieske 2Fe-2S domain-containing protein [Paraflavitalea sp. CAU 1676]
MAAQQLNWHKVAEGEAELILSETKIAVVEVKGKKICLGKYQEEWFGFAYKCPHASGIMQDGYIDALGNIVCPLHRYKFSVKNGRNTSGEGYFLKTYPVQLREDGMFVGLPDAGLFGSW